ncbi:nucleotide kinase [Yersinia phage vB_YenP_Rambo]|uniref:Nucleotide kinase n=1 Tax=Yersinia phage vB_YenP_Rambo TaxID=2880894 RepID=A0AC61TPG5_9CAUD|nr:nucleotide kinase [Yersinia phage vB_YenP_Rambo]
MSHYMCETCFERYDYCKCDSVKKDSDSEKVDRYQQHVITKLVDANTDKADSDNCGASINCKGVACRECPLNGYTKTMGDVRKMDDRQKSTEPQPQAIEGVTKPSHYMLFDDIEAIEVIARSMTVEQFKGYCLGNILKYRLRAGKKSELAYLEKDLAKADFYKELFEKHKDKCHV